MIVPLLLVAIALIAYSFGSVSSVNLSSNLYFHWNIAKEFPRDNDGITRFMNAYGAKGVTVLLGFELLRTVIPMIAGGLLLGIVDHADIGRAFAMFCVLLGTVFPAMYRFKGETSLVAFFVCLAFIDFVAAIIAALAFAAVYYLTHYISLGAVAAAVVTCLASVLIVDESLVRRLLLFSAILIVIEHRKSLTRIIRGEEPELLLRRDVGYIFDGDGENN